MSRTKHIIFLIVLGLSSLSKAQDVQLTVQTGHSSSINCLKFSPTDDLIATGGEDHNIILWDFFTGKQLIILAGHQAPVKEISFHPNKGLLISASLDSTVKYWDILTGACTKTIKLKYPVFNISFSPDGNSFVTAGHEIALFDFVSLKKETLPIHPKKEFTSLRFSDTGNLLAFGGIREDLAYLVDLSNLSLLKKITAAVSDFKFDSTYNTLIYSTAQGMVAEIGISEKSRKSTTTDWMLNAINAIAINDKQLFTANDNGEVYCYERESWFQTSIYKSKKTKIKAMELSHNGSFIATAGNSKSIVIWDLGTNQVAKVLTGSVNKINAIAFSKNGEEILIGYDNGALRKTNLITNQSILNSTAPNIKVSNNRFLFSVYEILSFEKDSAIVIVHKKRYSLHEENSFDKIIAYNVIWHFKDNYISMHELDDLTGQAKLYLDDKKNGINHSPDFLINPNGISYSHGIDNINVAQNDIKLQNIHTKKTFPAQHSDKITSLAYNETYGFFATAGWDGIIRFWSFKNGELLSIYGAFTNGQFVYINPDGYYYASKKALDYIGFRIDGKIYSFEQFDLQYNRPDLVAKYLPYFNEDYIDAYKLAFEKRLSKLGLNLNSLTANTNPPKLSYERNTSQLLLTGKLMLSVVCEDSFVGLDRLHIKVNGVPEFGRFGKEITGNTYAELIEIELTPGSNYIQLYTTNKHGVSSFKESFNIESHQKDVPSNLYLISIGVSKHIESQYDLNFASKDARDINDYFSNQFGLYNKIKTKLLVDTSVTLSNIYNLKDFLSDAQPNDAVIVFIAGHGVLDENLDYYLATHEMSFKNPSEKGIPYELFEELLDNTKSRKKVMLLDACHSGEIDKGEVIKLDYIDTEQGDIKFRNAGFNIKDKGGLNTLELAKSLFADMRLNNGTTVVSSAGGTEYAIESEKWRNGAFTYALLNGLITRNADLNKNRTIMLSELQEYLLFEVKKITNGQQTPTSRVENLNNDFRIN